MQEGKKFLNCLKIIFILIEGQNQKKNVYKKKSNPFKNYLKEEVQNLVSADNKSVISGQGNQIGSEILSHFSCKCISLHEALFKFIFPPNFNCWWSINFLIQQTHKNLHRPKMLEMSFYFQKYFYFHLYDTSKNIESSHSP